MPVANLIFFSDAAATEVIVIFSVRMHLTEASAVATVELSLQMCQIAVIWCVRILSPCFAAQAEAGAEISVVSTSWTAVKQGRVRKYKCSAVGPGGSGAARTVKQRERERERER